MAALIHYPDGPDMRRIDVLPTGITLFGRPGHPTTLQPAEPIPADRCVIRSLQGQWCLKVLSADQGTFVNNQRVHDERILSHQDTIRCGGLRVRFSIIHTGDTVPPPPRDKELDKEPSPPADPSGAPLHQAAPPSPYARLSRQQLVDALVRGEQALSTLHADLQILRSSNDALTQERNQAHTARVRCEEQLRAETQVSQSLREDLQQRHADWEEADTERLTLRRDLETLKEQRESDRKQAALDAKEWAQERQRLSLQIQEAQQIQLDNETLRKQVSDLQKVVRAQADYQDALARRTEVEEELRSLGKKNDELRKERDEARRESARLKDELARLQGRSTS
jgi:hypothetical protein